MILYRFIYATYKQRPLLAAICRTAWSHQLTMEVLRDHPDIQEAWTYPIELPRLDPSTYAVN